MKRKLKKNKIVMRTIIVKKKKLTQPRWVIDPETGEKISRTGLAMRECRRRGGLLEVVDMDAVLK